jgi:hypothetical protein
VNVIQLTSGGSFSLNMIVQETLLASLAVSPFIRNVPPSSWHSEVYGLLWFLALTSDVASLTVTTMFLAFLHSIPAELSYMWVCNLGAWMAIPIILVILCAVTSAMALTFTLWVIYGTIVGAVCAIIELWVVWFCVKAANALACATITTERLLNEGETQGETADDYHIVRLCAGV